MSVEIVPCLGHPGHIDLIDSHSPDGDPHHMSPGEWTEFVEKIKSGQYDDPFKVEPPAKGAHPSAGMKG